MNKRIRALMALAAAAALVWLLVWGYQRNRREAGEEDQPVKPPARVWAAASGESVVMLDARTQASIGLKTESVRAIALQPETVAYGTLLEDPSRSFVVRAPVPGRVRTAAGGTWPSLGLALPPGSLIGNLDPLLGPVDRVNLRDRLVAAQAELETASASVAASRAAYERTLALNADDKNLSDRALQEAEARLKSDEARVKAAKESVALLRSAPEGLLPLVAEQGGQVVDTPVQPGESVEGGQAVLRVASFDQLLAKVELPAGQAIAVPPKAARLIVLGHEDRPLQGTSAGLAASVDPKTQGQSLLFRVQSAGLNFRPGMAVTARIPQPGTTRSGAVAPRAALVRHGGLTWVYVEASPGNFVRRQVSLDRPVENGWATAGLHGGERIVVVGAQALLSEEFKSQIQVGEANEAR